MKQPDVYTYNHVYAKQSFMVFFMTRTHTAHIVDKGAQKKDITWYYILIVTAIYPASVLTFVEHT